MNDDDKSTPKQVTGWDVRQAIGQRLQRSFNDACRRLGCEQGNNDEASIAMLNAIGLLDKWNAE